MSRSIKKTPITGCCGGSDKYGKQKANRRLRRIHKHFIRNGHEILPMIKDISDVWSREFNKDGKVYNDLSKCDNELKRQIMKKWGANGFDCFI